MMLFGLIVKITGGFYYVESNDKIYECKARGIFRNKNKSPFVGDYVDINVPDDNSFSSIEKIHERKNSIIRPPVANIDNLIIVSSVVEPDCNLFIIDKMIAVATYKNIHPIVVFTKTDLSSADKYLEIYKNSSIECYSYNSINNEGIDKIKDTLIDKVTVFTGNSGVGKSTLINALCPELSLETSKISNKLGRGKHTTRTVELFKKYGGYIADTPGFSTLDVERYEIIMKDDLKNCFPEFSDYINDCQFTSCSHTVEKGCNVLKALDQGMIEKSRHDSYVKMYNEVKNIKEWQLKS